MTRKIKNPFVHLPGYQCFGCAPDNMHGLRMTFEEAEDTVVCKWYPQAHFQGWFNILHGGIQASLIDEIASWVVFVKIGRAGVTSELSVRYKKAVRIDNNEYITLRATLREYYKNIAVIDVQLLDASETVCATAVCKYFTYNEEVSREKFFFPDKEAFFNP